MSERAEDQKIADDMRARYLELANAPRATMGDAWYRSQLRKHPAPVLSPDLNAYVDDLFDCEKV